MPRLRFGVTRHPDVLRAIERAVGPDGRLTCRLGAGRVYLTWRGAGATRWTAADQLARARELAAAARSVLAADPRRSVRVHAGHAVVVRFEDASVVQGCPTEAAWECVVPGPTSHEALPPAGAARGDGAGRGAVAGSPPRTLTARA